MDFRFTKTLSFMVQHLEFLHVVYMGVVYTLGIANKVDAIMIALVLHRHGIRGYKLVWGSLDVAVVYSTAGGVGLSYAGT
jgi:hypothetical protein